MKNIPVCQPRLPKAKTILPYLEQIDANQWYTNFGPLVLDFLNRIAKAFNISRSHVVSGSNGTQLLELCLKAMNIKPGSLCVMPAWTFIATPLAAVSAQLEPLFVDVDLESQTLNPEQLLADLPTLKRIGNIGAVMVTAPFGQPVDSYAWDRFTEQTGIPVIIDAAAGFDSVLQQRMAVSTTPLMISLHATKVFGIGECGLIFSKNADLISRIEELVQFGFPRGVRYAHSLGTNAKISEYVAAVGLAALDQWDVTRREWQEILNHYMLQFEKTGLKHLQSSDWVTSTCNVIVDNQADSLFTALGSQGIMARKWWAEGCHHHPVFKTAKCGSDLKNTEWLQKSVLGLPCFLGMTNEVIENITRCLSS